MKRVGQLFDVILSEQNLALAIDEVNRSHHWHARHRPNPCTAWVEETKAERIAELRNIIRTGFQAKEPKTTVRWDASARKHRTIREPAQWPDQYVHHALIQAIMPICMRGMDPYCCGSIRGRGPHYGRRAIERWMDRDQKGTRYTLSGDIRHFYDSLQPEVVMDRMRQLIKDRNTLDLIWRVIRGGIMIGAYPSQWMANTTLQPLDQLVRQSGLAAHYLRYIDNLTVFGASKRKLRKLKTLVEQWLKAHGMELKGDWQIFRTVGRTGKEPLPPPRNGLKRPKKRLPDAMGYRYGRGFTLPRKHNLIRLKRAVARYRRRRNAGRYLAPRTAQSILSRCGQMKHCNNVHIYKIIFRGERIIRELKDIIRRESRKERETWNMYLERRARAKPSEPRGAATPT